MDIVEFILARIAEDEVLAREAVDGSWAEAIALPRDDSGPVRRFAEQWTPWRVLSLCALGRQVLAEHRMVRDGFGRASCASCSAARSFDRWPCPTLLRLADAWNHDQAFREDRPADRPSLRRIS